MSADHGVSGNGAASARTEFKSEAQGDKEDSSKAHPDLYDIDSDRWVWGPGSMGPGYYCTPANWDDEEEPLYAQDRDVVHAGHGPVRVA